MKRIILPFAILSMSLVACGGSKKIKTSDQIVVAELKTPCECVDAMGVVVDEMVATTDPFKTRKELYADKGAMEKMDKLEQKLKEIDARCLRELKIPKEEAEKCTGFSNIDAKHDKLEEKM